MEILGVIVLAIVLTSGMVALAFRIAQGIGADGRDLIPIPDMPRFWAAKQCGSCCTCGHDWAPGEIIGNVTQAYVIDDAGQVWHRPGVRQACAMCVEWQQRDGDLSLRWVDVAHLDLS